MSIKSTTDNQSMKSITFTMNYIISAPIVTECGLIVTERGLIWTECGVIRIECGPIVTERGNVCICRGMPSWLSDACAKAGNGNQNAKGEPFKG